MKLWLKIFIYWFVILFCFMYTTCAFNLFSEKNDLYFYSGILMLILEFSIIAHFIYNKFLVIIDKIIEKAKLKNER